MVKLVEGAKVSLQKPWWTSKGIVLLHVSTRVSHAVYLRVTTEQFQRALEHQRNEPVPYPVPAKDRTYWHFQDRFFSDVDGLDASKVRALVLTRRERRDKDARRAEAILAMPEVADKPGRPRIPADVQHLVFLRDGGQCVTCKNSYDLEFDHVIPFSFGGSSSEENLQLLCGPCNRRKGASFA